MKQISPEQLQTVLREGALALDVRPMDQFATAHVPGSINIALSGQFASWAGTVLGLHADPVLIAETAEQIAEARLRLARVGMEQIAGELEGGIQAWIAGGLPVAAVPQVTVQELEKLRQSGSTQVLDVRREPEWQAGHLADANWWPLDNFRVSPPEFDHHQGLAVHCKSGYRSMIACSLLQRAGFNHVVNVVGGYDAWVQANLPTTTAAAANA